MVCFVSVECCCSGVVDRVHYGDKCGAGVSHSISIEKSNSTNGVLNNWENNLVFSVPSFGVFENCTDDVSDTVNVAFNDGESQSLYNVQGCQLTTKFGVIFGNKYIFDTPNSIHY